MSYQSYNIWTLSKESVFGMNLIESIFLLLITYILAFLLPRYFYQIGLRLFKKNI